MPYSPDLSDANDGAALEPSERRVHDTNYVLNEIKRLTNPLLWSVFGGDAYRVSKRHTLADGEELIVHFVPVDTGGTIHIETPAITTPTACDIDVWENASPDGTVDDTADDLFVHAMRYDVSPEAPEATVQRVTNGSLDTSTADQTEQTRVEAGEQYNTPGGTQSRGLWRTIPVGERVSFVITDQSNGSGNVYGFDTVVHEGNLLPD